MAYISIALCTKSLQPQWSPVLETGNGPTPDHHRACDRDEPQWSPVLETGNGQSESQRASPDSHQPQWSPVLETGNG